MRAPRLRTWLVAWLVGLVFAAQALVLVVVLPVVGPAVFEERSAGDARRVALALQAESEIARATRASDARTVVRLAAGRVDGQATLVTGAGEVVRFGPDLISTAAAPARGVARIGEVTAGSVALPGGSRLILATGPGDGAREVALVRRSLLLSALAVLLIAALIGSRISRVLAGQLTGLASQARRVADGDLDARAPEDGPTREMVVLSQSLNDMADRLGRQLREIEDERVRAARMVDALDEGVLAIGPDGAIRRANPSARSLLGMPPDLTVVPERTRALFPPAGGHVEITLAQREIHITRARGADGEEVIAVRDVTDERRVARARQELVANVGHELKTPLAAIRGMLELIEQVEMEPDERHHFITLMLDDCNRLARLVDEQLELARIDAGAIAIEIRPTALDGVISGVVSARQPLAQGAGITLTERGGPCDALCDPERVAQILFILLDNAIRHTPAGGRITVSSHMGSQGPVIEVTDSGGGITPQDMPFIFDRFFQADPARTGGGAGLGLAIARGLARAQGGDLTARSRPGAGATFRLALPRAPKRAGADAGAVASCT